MTDNDRTEKLLAMLLVNSMGTASQKEKAVALNSAGFSPAEIADLLNSSSASISQQLYEARSKKKGTHKGSAKSL